MAIVSNVKAPKQRDFKGKVTPVTIQTSFYQPIKATKNDLKSYLATEISQYGGNFSLLDKVIECESSYRTDVYSSNRSSYGVCQFTKPTFSENCTGDYENPYNQILCMVLMAKRGMLGRWDCLSILK